MQINMWERTHSVVALKSHAYFYSHLSFRSIRLSIGMGRLWYARYTPDMRQKDLFRIHFVHPAMFLAYKSVESGQKKERKK